MSQDDFQDELIEQQAYDTEENTELGRLKWPKYVAIIAGIALAVAGPTMISMSLWPTVFMAYINCVLYLFFAMRFLKKGTLGGIIPVVAPLWMILGSCVGVIYFAIFSPNEAYETQNGFVSRFAGGLRYQMVIFCLLITYFSTMAWLLRNDNKVSQHPRMATKYVGYMSMAIILPILLASSISMAIDLPVVLQQWTNRLFVYYQSLLFATGVVIVRISKPSKIFLIGSLGLIALLYLLKDARGMALVPISSLVAAILLFSEMRPRTKVTLMMITILCIPFYVLVGSTLRTLLGAGGAREHGLAVRISALKDWRSAVSDKPFFGSVLGRLFFTGGNVVIAYTPSLYSYRPFSPIGYCKEFGLYMLPEPIIRRLMPSLGQGKLYTVLATTYTTPYVLRDYGIFISENASVETSIIGHFWMLGGYVFVLFGGCALALVHGAVAWIVRRAWIQNPDKGVFYLAALFYPILWTTNWDLIQLTRTLLMTFIFAFIGYRLIKPILEIGYATSNEGFNKPSGEEMYPEVYK